MRAGVLVAVGGIAAVLVATVPASAFNSGSDPASYYTPQVRAIEAHRGWQGNEGVAFEEVGPFTQRLPDDEFDDILLNLVNWYRSDNGLPPLEQFEPLRVQSAIRSNQLADAGTATMPDRWYAGDAYAACNPVQDTISSSGVTAGTPEDVYLKWVSDPATRNALLAPDPGAVGIATVAEGSQFYTTIRIVHGTCPGNGLPFRTNPSTLPVPDLVVDITDDGLAISVDRRGDQQQTVQIQRAEGWVWRSWRELTVQPGADPVTVAPPGGIYRVVVPQQSGYATTFTDALEVPGPPAPTP